MAALCIKPENCRRVAQACACNRQLDPVLNGGVFGLTHAPQIPFFHLVLKQHVAGGIRYPYHAVGRHHESFVVRAVLFSRLRHEADIRHTAHGCRIERAICFTVVDNCLVHTGIAAIRNNGLRCLLLAFGIPHSAGIANYNGHGSIDNDVAGHVQVGDAFIGVHHG